MLKEAIETIIDHATGKVLSASGRPYSRHTLEPLPAPESECKPVELHTLSGMAMYVDSALDADGEGRGAALFVDSPAAVSLRSGLFGDFRQRETFAVCQPFLSKSFPFGRYLSAEEFIVALQAGFVHDESAAAILKVVGNLRAEAVTSLDDDGVSQQVTARSGVARVENVAVPNPVELRPYRTFQEIDQPASQYVLRMRRDDNDGLPSIALHEVLSDQWQVEALRSISLFFIERKVKVEVFA